jgi:hypothetical protein
MMLMTIDFHLTDNSYLALFFIPRRSRLLGAAIQPFTIAGFSNAELGSLS